MGNTTPALVELTYQKVELDGKHRNKGLTCLLMVLGWILSAPGKETQHNLAYTVRDLTGKRRGHASGEV